MTDVRPVRRALISVFDKCGISEFSRFLSAAGVQIFSTGGTAVFLQRQGLAITDVAAYTGFPEIMGGRVKTLHPLVHGGLLGREPLDRDVMQEHGIEPIDLLIVNLYPFEEIAMRGTADPRQCIEQIDIGGAAMIRSAAKNHQRVTVAIHPDDYTAIEHEMKELSGISLQLRTTLAAKAFARMSDYDAAIADWFFHGLIQPQPSNTAQLPERLQLSAKQAVVLRYGENPHQSAAFYRRKPSTGHFLDTVTQLQGKSLSFNNIVDAETADKCVHEFSEPACVIVKHANPCGVACAQSVGEAYQHALAADSEAAFGGVVALNRTLETTVASQLVNGVFTELVIAPGVADRALPILSKKTSLRVLQGRFCVDTLDCRNIAGGVMVQTRDTVQITRDDLQVQGSQLPNAEQISGLLFAWRVAKYVKSNAIVLATTDAAGCRTVGIGGGQTSRVAAVRTAVAKAAADQINRQSLVMASDAFFPFADSIDCAAQAGVRAVIQPGGSTRDAEVIAAAERHAIAMVFTGIRHFRH